MTTQPTTRRRWPAFIAVALLTLAVHGVDLTHQFTNWDDSMLLTDNPLLNPVTGGSFRQMWSGPVVRLYTPLAYTLWAAGLQITREPWLFHAINVLLHTASALLVLGILLRLTGGRVIASAIGAAVFAVHPLQVEPVAWVAGMNNLLAGMFSLASVLFWLRPPLPRGERAGVRGETFDDKGRPLADRSKPAGKPSADSRSASPPSPLPSPLRGEGVAVLFFVLACLSKPTAIVTPLVLLVIDLLILGRRPRWTIGLMVVLAVPFVWIGWNVQEVSTAAPSLLQRIPVAADALGFYLHKLAWPWPLYIDYGRTPESVLGTHPLNWIALAIAGLVAGATLKRWPRVAGSLGVFVAGVCLVLGLVPFDFQVYSTVADRYVYLSMLGPAILVALVLARAPKAACGFAACVVVVLAVLSVRQSLTWATTDTLVAQQCKYNPASLAAHTILAARANERHDTAAAEQHFRAILAAHPADANANRQLAGLLSSRGQFAESLPFFQAAYAGGDHSAVLLNYWGLALWKTNDVPEAAAKFDQAARTDPANFDAHLNLGLALARLGRFDEAAAHLRRAMELDPTSALARDTLAKVDAIRAKSQNR